MKTINKTIEQLIGEQYGFSSGRGIVLSKVARFRANPSVRGAQELENLVEGIAADIAESDADFSQRGEQFNQK